MKLNRTSDCGGTGLRPVVSGVAPETRSELCNMWVIFLNALTTDSRKKSGVTPDLTGATPVPP